MKLELELTERELGLLHALVTTADPYDAADSCRVNTGTEESPWYVADPREMEQFVLKLGQIIADRFHTQRED